MEHGFSVLIMPSEVIADLYSLYVDPTPLIEKWNQTQVREPYDAGEVEDVFYELEGSR